MFDRYLVGRRPSWKRRAVLLASLGAHGMAAVAFLVWSVFHVESVEPPPLAVVFHAMPPMGGGGSPAERPKSRTPRPPRPRVARPLVQPRTDAPPTTPAPADDPGPADGPPSDGPVGEGSGGPGIPGGAPCVGPCAATPTPARPVAPRNVPPHYLDTQALYRPDPHLPDVIKLQHRGTGDATFIAKVCIDERGEVSQIGIVQGIPGADADITATLRSWRYKPQGIPVCFLANWVFHVE